VDTEGWRFRKRKAKVSLNTGEAIRTFREARGLTQAELADAIGMSAPYWSKLENNRKGPPKLETLQRVRVAFDRKGKPLEEAELLELFSAALRQRQYRPQARGRAVPDLGPESLDQRKSRGQPRDFSLFMSCRTATPLSS